MIPAIQPGRAFPRRSAAERRLHDFHQKEEMMRIVWAPLEAERFIQARSVLTGAFLE